MEQNAKTVLVTGATGFIASHTCVELIEAGYKVVGIDNFVNSKPEVLNKIKAITGVEIAFYEGDVNDANILKKIFFYHYIMRINKNINNYSAPFNFILFIF